MLHVSWQVPGHALPGQVTTGRSKGKGKTMSRQWWALLGLLGLLVVAPSAGCIFAYFRPMSPARQSNDSIREEILLGTPLGSTEDDVDRYAKSCFNQDNFFHWQQAEDGGRILECLYGCYVELPNFPFATCVRVSWHFPQGATLAHVSVGRWLDGP
jgi:hypothetical protein